MKLIVFISRAMLFVPALIIMASGLRHAAGLAMFNICDALRDLVPFVQFKKREKHPWRSVNFSKVAGFSLVFFTFFHDRMSTKNSWGLHGKK